jgi:hypothetical protein
VTARPSAAHDSGGVPSRMQSTKWLHLELEGLLQVDVRRADVAVAVGVRPLERHLPLRRRLDPAVVDPQALLGEIVVDRHASRADDGDPAHLVGIQPGDVDVARDAPVAVVQADVGQILPVGAGEGGAPGGDAGRQGLQKVVHDGDVVRGQIPDDIDVPAVQAEIQAGRVNVVDVAELAGAYPSPQLAHRGIVLEGVTDHQQPVGLVGDAHHLARLVEAGGQWLLDQDVLACLQGQSGDGGVAFRRGGDDHRIQCGQSVLQGGEHLDRRKDRPELAAQRLVPVDRDDAADRRQPAQHTDMLRAPIATTDHADPRPPARPRRPQPCSLSRPSTCDNRAVPHRWRRAFFQALASTGWRKCLTHRVVPLFYSR